MTLTTRRGLLSSDRTAVCGELPSIASLIVQAKPERLDIVASAVGRLPGSEIYARDERGKLVIVIESASDGLLGLAMTEIAGLPGVLGVSLVFHHAAQG